MSQSGPTKVQFAPPPEVATSYVADVGIAVPAGNILNVLGGIGIQVTGAGDTLTIASVSSGFTWNVVTSANNPVNLVNQNGYIAKGAGVVNFVLPPAAAVGDTYWIKGIGNLWTLAQNALQTVSLGYVTSTMGVGGSFTATQVKDALEILCVTQNTEFEVLTSVGNPTIV